MFVLAIISCVVLVAIDQITKYAAVVYLRPLGSVALIDGIIALTFVENRGAAFGILQGGRWFFIVLTIFLLVGICIYYYKLPRTKLYSWVRFTLVLITSGAVGNFIDRFKNGYVVDFFHAEFINFPVFNMADIYVVCGTVFLSILLLFFIKNEDTVEDAQILPEAPKNA